MMDYLFRDKINKFTMHIGRTIGRTGISPNSLTILGFLLAIVSAYALSRGEWMIGGFLLLFSSVFDVFDGAVARAYGKVSNFGNYFDAVTDKYGEGLILIGVGMGSGEWLLSSVALLGSIMCSYTRHRVDYIMAKLSDLNKVGILERAERTVILGVGCMLGYVVPALWIICIFANLTSLLRIINAKKLLS